MSATKTKPVKSKSKTAVKPAAEPLPRLTTEVLALPPPMSDLIKSIAETNAEFKALSAAERRVAIARDVIAQVKAGRYFAKTGTYFNLSFGQTELASIAAVCAIGDLQQLMNVDRVDCTVCGLGACFASAVRLSNTVVAKRHDVLREYWRDELQIEFNAQGRRFESKLDQFFSQKQISMIECAFEMDASHDRMDAPDENDGDDFNPWALKAEKFGKLYGDDAERLCAIMENIANNSGQFIP